MGVRHQSRNYGMGGLGTVQNGIAGGSIYGPDVDLLVWDSGMTEHDLHSIQGFGIQGMIGGIKVPYLTMQSEPTMRELNQADIDLGFIGRGQSGLPTANTLDELNALAWAVRYLSCGPEIKDICNANKYSGLCWIDRDEFAPPVKQQAAPGGRAGWHPGNRSHQLTARIITFRILLALKEALQIWNEADNYELADDVWHVTAHYENIRSKVPLENKEAICYGFSEFGMNYVCDFPMKVRILGMWQRKSSHFFFTQPFFYIQLMNPFSQGRTEFTPRAYPSRTSLRSLMSPQMLEHINDPPRTFYDPPDLFNSNLHPAPGEIDVLNIVEAGVDFRSTLNPDYTAFYKTPTFEKPPQVPIGKGAQLVTKAGDHTCDGTVDSWCARGYDSPCLMYGHNDGRNGIAIDGYSGWLVFNIPDLLNGHIAIKFESWHLAGSNTKTDGWESVNNEGRRQLQSGKQLRGVYHSSDSRTNHTSTDVPASIPVPRAPVRPTIVSSAPQNSTFEGWETYGYERMLGEQPAPYCDEFHFEYAIDGKITSLSKDEYLERKKDVQRVVEIITLLEDPNYTGGVEKEVEVAVRITGCQRTKTFHVTHLYWT